ncbi:ammonium transporter [Pectinatus frisingensis]|uniref:ammonium transporter n=1 Tax=Pectinatus frisingensis TaxID=865 RepID=UPI0018C66754|nr:ammonium transporter [Pectinatus frisingensis]
MKKLWSVFLSTFMLMVVTTPIAFAATDAPKIDSGDTAWVLVSAALVFIMTPGLGFFYGGMVRSKNVLTTIMHSFFIVGMISVEWFILGYTMAFGDDATGVIPGIIGSLDKIGLAGTAGQIWTGTSIPELAFVAFQCMFAVITPALITGAFAERVRFKAYALFVLLWAIFIYNPMAHMVWGGGKLFELGALDFAGGLVIHILSGVSGLVICILVGKRKGYGKLPILPHHLPMTVLGATLLWFGWFGFNAGSALGANELAANALITTQAAAAMATVSWVVCEWLHNGKPTILGAASGCIAGLVAITPAAGFVAPMPAVIIGIIGGAVCYFAVAIMKAKLGYDDALDAFGVHGIGGTWGAIATGLWASTAVNSAGANGLFYGDSTLLVAQIISIIVAYLLGGIGSFVLFKVVNAITPFRADEAEEISGLDIVEHGERGYSQSIMTGESLGIQEDITKIN